MLSSFLESTGDQTPTTFQDPVSLLIEKLDLADSYDPRKELSMELIETRTLQEDLTKWEEKSRAPPRKAAKRKSLDACVRKTQGS